MLQGTFGPRAQVGGSNGTEGLRCTLNFECFDGRFKSMPVIHWHVLMISDVTQFQAWYQKLIQKEHGSKQPGNGSTANVETS